VTHLFLTVRAALAARLHAAWLRLASFPGPRLARSEAGQATAEYALVVVGAAAVAFAFITWVSGSGHDKIGHLLNAVIDHVTDVVS
jgi:hypothetical protein